MSSRPLVVALLAAGVAACAASASTTAAPGFFGCRTYSVKHPAAVTRPRSIVVACGDGNFYLTRITWSSWSATKAVGAGRGHENDCNPNCAAGHFHVYPATVTLSKPRSCYGHKVFTTLAWRFTKPVKGYALTGATTFNC